MSSRPRSSRFAPRSHSLAPSPNHPLAPGFTLLETLLALVLGTLVVFAAAGLFRVVDHSDRRSRIKMEENLEFATAHATIMRAFHMLLMSDEQPPNEKDVDDFLKQDDERNSADRLEQEDEEAASSRLVLGPETNNPIRMTIGDEDHPRLAPSQVMRITLRDTPIAGAGIKTEDELAEQQAMRDRILSRGSSRLNKRIGDKASGRSRDSASSALDQVQKSTGLNLGGLSSGGGGDGDKSGGSDMDSGRSDGRRRISLHPPSGSRSSSGSGFGGKDSGTGLNSDFFKDGHKDDRSASEELQDEEENRPRAPGVRGVFVLLPDGETPGGGYGEPAASVHSAGSIEPDAGPTYALWWRELPPIEVDPLTDPAGAADDAEKSRGADGESFFTAEKSGSRGKSGGRSAASAAHDRSTGRLDGDAIDRRVQQLADSSDSGGRQVRLLSGLKTCHWTAFRGRKEREKITAKFDRHLPAFVQLEIVTAGGRRENWIFDVAWLTGPEPGSVVSEKPDALNGGLAGGIPGLNLPTTDPSSTDPNGPNGPNSNLNTHSDNDINHFNSNNNSNNNNNHFNSTNHGFGHSGTGSGSGGGFGGPNPSKPGIGSPSKSGK